MKISVVIVNYKTPGMVLDCLESFSDESLWDDMHVVIVDNCSKDDSLARIREGLPEKFKTKVTLVDSPINGGFAAGNNLGIAEFSADYYLLLNSDTLLRPDSVSALAKLLEAHPECGLASPRLEWPDGRPQESCFRFHSPVSELIRSANTGPITQLFKQYEVALPVQDGVSYPEWTSFACVMIRREVMEALGGLNEDYFMYFEDVEFCRRAREKGWRIVNDPNIHVVHLRGGTSPLKAQARLKKRLPRYNYESRTRYFNQFYGRAGLLAANLLWTLGGAISSARSKISAGYDSSVCAKQWTDTWINFSKPERPYVHPDDYREKT